MYFPDWTSAAQASGCVPIHCLRQGRLASTGDAWSMDVNGLIWTFVLWRTETRDSVLYIYTIIYCIYIIITEQKKTSEQRLWTLYYIYTSSSIHQWFGRCFVGSKGCGRCCFLSWETLLLSCLDVGPRSMRYLDSQTRHETPNISACRMSRSARWLARSGCKRPYLRCACAPKCCLFRSVSPNASSRDVWRERPGDEL